MKPLKVNLNKMELIDYLKQEPRARERKNKNRAIGYIVRNKYDLVCIIDKEMMADMIGEILSLDRKWRKILEENPELRGTDYKDKDLLEEKKLQELGYLTP